MSPRNPKDSRRGQIILLSPVLLVVLGAMLALTVDVGYALVTRARLQNAADAASLAGAQVLMEQQGDGVAEEGARAAATAEAVAFVRANTEEAGFNIEFGILDENGTFQEVGVDTAATVVRATAFRNGDAPGKELPFCFAPLLGINSCEVASAGASAIATNIRGVRAGVTPFAVAEECLVAPGEVMDIYPAGDDEGPGKGKGQVAPGNWGLLNLDGGSCGTPELRDWILNGYDGEMIIGEGGHLWMDGTPGFRATLEDEICQRIGDPLIMVIYDEVTGQGANADYRCVGFVCVTILECDLTGQDSHVTCRVEEVCDLHDLVVGGSYSSPNMTKISLVN